MSQSESGGPFLWKRHARTATLSCDVGEQPAQTWSAEHDGYVRLNAPTTHRRSVTLDSPARRLTVIETIYAARGTPIRLSWHLGPDVAVDLEGSQATLSWPIETDLRRATLLLPDGLLWNIRRADLDPIEGWYAPRFGTRVPANTLVGRGIATSTTHLVTQLELP